MWWYRRMKTKTSDLMTRQLVWQFPYLYLFNVRLHCRCCFGASISSRRFTWVQFLTQNFGHVFANYHCSEQAVHRVMPCRWRLRRSRS